MLDNFKCYIKKGWKNAPDKSTPLSADNLDYMDSGIKNNADAIKEIAGAVSQKLENNSEKIPTMNLLFEVNKNAKEDSKNASDIANEAKGVAESAIGNFSDKYVKKTYKKGETCIQDNVLYEANADINTAEDWNAAHWTETSVEKIRAKMRQELDVVNTNIANITPDDTAVDGKPWTSKHIVDMLCPPLEVSGNPVQCYPVAGYPLGITASWEPTQEGSGDPSPENIRPIKGRNSVSVERCGENLLKHTASSLRMNGINVQIDDSGHISVSGKRTQTGWVALMPFYLNAGTYTATVCNFSGTGRTPDILKNYTYQPRTFTLPERALMRIAIGGAVDDEYDYECDIMIVSGTEAPTEYHPYIGDTTTLTLPETIYGGSVDAVTGEGAQTHVLTLLTGQENWRKAESGALSAPVPIGNAIRGAYALCSVAPPEYAYSGGGIYTTTDTIIFGDRFGAQYAGVEAWTAYLATQYAAGTPVQVVYKLATPIGFQASDGDTMPALGGINTVLTDADSAEVTGREDLIHAIAGQ